MNSVLFPLSYSKLLPLSKLYAWHPIVIAAYILAFFFFPVVSRKEVKDGGMVGNPAGCIYLPFLLSSYLKASVWVR